MFKCIRSALFLVLIFTIISPNVNAAKINEERPKIGLALSGGGARGAAHVGVIRELEKLQIPIDYIAGTSMGAVVGGLYASGMSSDEIEQQLKSIDWGAVFNDKPTRVELSQRRKTDDLLYLIKGKVGVSEKGVSIPNAAVQGQKFDLILKKLTLPVTGIDNFDDLPIPYRAVAMDIVTGEEVVIASGDLSIAMHASMAIPAAFAPIELNGQLLVDGGSANNLPISVVRDMGADIVIAIDISTPLLKKDELGRALAVIDQLAGLLTSRNVAAQVKTLTKKDVLIVPELGDVSTMSFDKVLDAVHAGEMKGREMKRQLVKLSLNDTDYQRYKSRHTVADWQAPVVTFVHFENNTSLSNEVLRERFTVKPGDPLDTKKIEEGLTTLYGLGVFQTIKYDLVTEDGKTGIVINAQEKAWGTDSLQAGLQLSSDFTGQSDFNIGFAYTMMPVNDLNGEWRVGLQLGENSSVFTEIYQPLDPAGRYFATAGSFFRNDTVRLYDDQSTPAESEYEVQGWELKAAIGRNFKNNANVRIGISRSKGSADIAVGDSALGNFDFDDGYYFIKGVVDTLDSLYFPRSGTRAVVEWKSAHDSLGADTDYNQVNANATHAQSWFNGTVIGSVRYGSTVSGDLSVNSLYQLGGFLKLSGLEKNQLSGQHSGLLTLAYQHRIYKSQLMPIYAGAVVQAGNVWQEEDDIKFNDLLGSGSIYLGVDSPVGPFYLGYGQTEGGNGAAYLFFGQPFF